MRRVVVFTNLTLDGVMQAPGRPDEDPRGAFLHGGWATPYAAMQSPAAFEALGKLGALLLGRRTYQDFFDVWPARKESPFSEMLNQLTKYVASTTLREPLPWMNSTLLKPDVPSAVARLKTEPGDDIVVMGSGDLLQTLMKHELVDRYVLLIHPLVLGSGRRLFPEGSPLCKLDIIDAKPTREGVVVLSYRPRRTG
jgi:dihydrofolate reductase